MFTNDTIADALSRVRFQCDRHRAHIVHSSEISRADREILLRTGWLQEIIRGWYMLVRPDIGTGDTSAWYSNFWDFTRIYLKHRFGDEYCLSAESSLDLHLENPTIPKQVIVIVNHGAGLRKLMYNTSLMIYADTNNFPTEIEKKQDINVMSLSYALCKVTPTYFKNNPLEAELSLRKIRSPDELTRIIISYRLNASAARIIGAYQFLKDTEMARKIKTNLEMVGIIVNPINPFSQPEPLLSSVKTQSTYAARIHAIWNEARNIVISHFPPPPGLPKKISSYLHKVDEIYQYDAYNSLSIEGYQVTTELIDKVKSKKWDPIGNYEDNNIKNAMAAKGYFDTFQQVRNCVKQVIEGEKAADIVKNNLQKWFQTLFGPSVKAGILPAEALFGYRNDRVFIRNSRHSPPRKELVFEAMETFFECLNLENHPGVKAVLGHYIFVYIHPYMDGNGRLARFLMNTMLASGGYPWTVIRVENRTQYISTLENTHIKFDITGFTKFIGEEVKASQDVFNRV